MKIFITHFKSLTGVIMFIFLLMIVGPVQAHLSNQTPFFKINGTYTPLYPISSDYNTNVTLPQDSGPENYLVNQELVFELDENNLPVAPGIIDMVTFEWDLGDGTKSQDLKVNHRYTKPGSYLISISAVWGSESPQLVQSTLINVLPELNYKLPQAKIRVNGKEVENNPQKRVKVFFNSPVNLDGNLSQAPSSKIVKYEWDLDNNQLPEGEKIKANYNNDSFDRVYPVLKVTDENGFISYALVGLERADQNIFKATMFKISDWASNNQQSIELAFYIIPLLIFSPIFVLMGREWLKRKKTKE